MFFIQTKELFLRTTTVQRSKKQKQKQMRDGIETSWHPGKKKEPKIPGKILSLAPRGFGCCVFFSEILTNQDIQMAKPLPCP
jgi:hypothetical protein